VSPRTYFVFTPLLNDTATGTLEFRNTLEPVRNRRFKGEYLQGWADDVNFANKTVIIEPSVLDPDVGHGLTGERRGNQTLVSSTGAQRVPTFEIAYDKLAICVGCYSQTFGTKGVREVSYLYFVCKFPTFNPTHVFHGGSEAVRSRTRFLSFHCLH
jgi:NADH dehydrogenase FAD-containing subunit